MEAMESVKSPEWTALVELLTVMVPACLVVYAVTFKVGDCEAYITAMMSLWSVLFLGAQRKHYDKAPTAMLQSLLQLRSVNHGLFHAYVAFLAL